MADIFISDRTSHTDPIMTSQEPSSITDICTAWITTADTAQFYSYYLDTVEA